MLPYDTQTDDREVTEMGLSLADAAVRGTQSTESIVAQKQVLLAAGDTEGLIALNHSLFGSATMMADADDDADDDGDDEEDDDSDDGDDDDDDDEPKGKKEDPKDERIRELSAEAKKRRIKTRQQRDRIAELEAENARLKGSKKSKKDDAEDDEDEQSESDEAKTLKRENEALKARLETQTIRQEFNDLLDDPKSKIKFKDRKAAFRLLDRDEIEIDEDGEVEGLEDAVKDLAKAYPFLVDDGKKSDEDEDDEDEQPRRRRTGQRTGGRQRKGNANADALRKKYGIKR